MYAPQQSRREPNAADELARRRVVSEQVGAFRARARALLDG
jgi:hypothetical protein